MKKKSFVCSLIAATTAIVLLSSSANALTFDYSGTWRIGGPLEGSFTGSFSYDVGLTGSAGTNGTFYSPASFNLDTSLNSISFSAGIEVTNNIGSGSFLGADIFQVGRIDVSGNLSAADSLDAIVGGNVVGFTINLIDNGGTIYSDESLPLTLDLNSFSTGGRNLALFYTTTGFDRIVQLGQLSSLSLRQEPVAPVPIPAALPLLLSALGGLGFFGWRRRKTVAT